MNNRTYWSSAGCAPRLSSALSGAAVMLSVMLQPLLACGLLLPAPLPPRALCTASRARALAMASDEPTNFVEQNLQPPSLEEQMKA